jgi:L-alanine-DL-glutamate epimerase-like enolase superfamily enzyme
MRITKVTPINLFVPIPGGEKLPISLPFGEQIGKVVFSGYRATLVRIETDTGVDGVGECLVRLAPRATGALVEELAPLLVGRDPHDVEPVWDMLYATMRQRGHVRGTMLEAMSGIDIALWDILGKDAGVPVCRLLGGQYRDRLWCYASSLRMRDIAIVVDEATRYVEQGFTAMKLKVGRDLGRTFESLVEVRKAVGDRIHLSVDANCAYDVPTAVRVGRRLEQHDVQWFEEPLAPDDVDGYAELARTLDVPIAAGECEFTRWGVKDLLVRRAVDIIQPDVARAGGFSECRKIGAISSAFNVPYAPHTGSSSAVCMAASIQLAAALPNFLIYEYMRSDWSATEPNPLRGDLVKEPVEVFEQGHILVPGRPGIGVELNEKVMSRYRV